MGKLYSTDLRDRAVGSAAQDGLSRRQAAVHFRVGISTVIRWVERFSETGRIVPGRTGGHRPKTLSGAHRDWLVARCREQDFTLRGGGLADRGLRVDYRSVQAFVHAEGLAHKKRRL